MASLLLTVTILSAESLEATKIDGTSDPYVTMQIVDGKRGTKWGTHFKTSVVKSTLNPVWNQKNTHQYKMGNKFDVADSIQFNVCDWNRIGLNTRSGGVALPVCAVIQKTAEQLAGLCDGHDPANPAVTFWALHVYTHGNEYQGLLHVKTRLQNLDQDAINTAFNVFELQRQVVGCPSYHRLHVYHPKGVTKCDMCDKQFPTEDKKANLMKGCNKCDWDVCIPCSELVDHKVIAEKKATREYVMLTHKEVVERKLHKVIEQRERDAEELDRQKEEEQQRHAEEKKMRRDAKIAAKIRAEEEQKARVAREESERVRIQKQEEAKLKAIEDEKQRIEDEKRAKEARLKAEEEERKRVIEEKLRLAEEKLQMAEVKLKEAAALHARHLEEMKDKEEQESEARRLAAEAGRERDAQLMAMQEKYRLQHEADAKLLEEARQLAKDQAREAEEKVRAVQEESRVAAEEAQLRAEQRLRHMMDEEQAFLKAENALVLKETKENTDSTQVDWQCEVCGMINPILADICGECEAARPVSVVVKVDDVVSDPEHEHT